MKAQDMMQGYRKFKRSWGTWYAFDNATGNSVSLKTRVRSEAVQKVNAMNETERQPSISLGLARVYLNATDPKLATRTWQEVMENIVAKKTDETRWRWETAIKDRNFDCIRRLPVAETRPEHFDRALADGKVSTNVYLRRIHNHVLGMEWLLKSVIPRLQWPKPVFKAKRAITGGRTRRHRRARAERGAAGLLRNSVAHRRVAIGRGLSAGGRCGLEHAHDFLLAQEAQGPRWHWHQAGADPVRRGCGGHPESESCSACRADREVT